MTQLPSLPALPEIVDLTRTLRHMGPSTLSQPVPMMWPTLTHERSSAAFEGALSIASMGVLLSDHAGTHVDAWSHLTCDPAAATIDAMRLTDFVGRGVVLDATDTAVDGVVGAHASHRADIPDGTDAVLVRTAAVPEPPPDRHTYLQRFPGVSAELVHSLADRGVRILGTDARSIDRSSDEAGRHGLPAHRACLDRGVVVVENLLLPADLVGLQFLFLALPLRLAGCTGSPVRAVALVDSQHRRSDV